MSTYIDGSGAGEAQTPLRSREDLLSVFRSGEKPEDRFGIGIEYERLPVSRETGAAVPYDRRADAPPGSRQPSVERFLEAMADRGGWTPAREEERIIALRRDGTMITIEPGAQVELSGRVHLRLEDACAELRGFVRQADEVANSLGFAFLPMGYHPFTSHVGIRCVPKSRYRIMAPYLAARGHLAHGMMKGTAGCQVNLDYSSEADAMEKIRTAMGISSLVTAMCANSPLTLGQANGFMSKRSHIWLHTDPDRCGLLPFAFRDDLRYEHYVDYALDVPMLFVVRDDRWVDMTGRTFRGYLGGASQGLTPTLADWQMHLTTLFPECRLKSWIEVRGSDSCPPGLIMAQAALWKGILYDARARRRGWDLVASATFEERARFHRDVARFGLDARLDGVAAVDLAADLLSAAAGGLTASEAPLIEPLRRIVLEDKAPPAAGLLARWRGEWKREPRRLVSALAPAATRLAS